MNKPFSKSASKVRYRITFKPEWYVCVLCFLHSLFGLKLRHLDCLHLVFASADLSVCEHRHAIKSVRLAFTVITAACCSAL